MVATAIAGHGRRQQNPAYRSARSSARARLLRRTARAAARDPRTAARAMTWVAYLAWMETSPVPSYLEEKAEAAKTPLLASEALMT